MTYPELKVTNDFELVGIGAKVYLERIGYFNKSKKTYKKGGFGQTYICKDDTGQKYIVKELYNYISKIRRNILRQQEERLKLNSLVEILCVIDDGAFKYVMPFIEGNTFSRKEQNIGRINNYMIQYLRQNIEIINSGFLNTDVNLANCLTNEKTGEITIIDRDFIIPIDIDTGEAKDNVEGVCVLRHTPIFNKLGTVDGFIESFFGMALDVYGKLCKDNIMERKCGYALKEVKNATSDNVIKLMSKKNRPNNSLDSLLEILVAFEDSYFI